MVLRQIEKFLSNHNFLDDKIGCNILDKKHFSPDRYNWFISDAPPLPDENHKKSFQVMESIQKIFVTMAFQSYGDISELLSKIVVLGNCTLCTN